MDEKAEVIFGLGTANEYVPNWTSLTGRKSLDELCHYIEVETNIKDRKRISKHMRFGVYYSATISPTLRIYRRPVMTGLVDNVDLDSSASKSSFVFNGRSGARNIVDSKWSETITGKTLFGVVKQIGAKFGLSCAMLGTNEVDSTGIIPEFAFENESPWAQIQQEAANQGYIVTSNQIGGLYVWRVATGLNQWGFEIKEGGNISGFKDTESGSSQYYRYVYRAGWLTAEGTDPTCADTSRLLTVNLPNRKMTQERLDQRVRTEIRRRSARNITATLSSWALSPDRIRLNSRRPDGHEMFWEPNFLTPVSIPSLEINSRLLTSQVEYRANKKSMSCDVQMVRPEVFSGIE